MGNDHKPAIEGLEIILKPGHGLDVQVVGRFVKEKEVWILHQYPCQGHSHLISTAEFPALPLEVLLGEA